MGLSAAAHPCNRKEGPACHGSPCLPVPPGVSEAFSEQRHPCVAFPGTLSSPSHLFLAIVWKLNEKSIQGSQVTVIQPWKF